MTSSMSNALDVDDLHVGGTLNLGGSLTTALLVALLLAVVLIAAAIYGSRARKERKPKQPQGMHVTNSVKDEWKQKVATVVEQYDTKVIDRDEAFAQLALIARSFASLMSGVTLHNSTLSDIPRVADGKEQQNWNMLRQTIAALYPPEFADANHHPAARDVSVKTAADWVSSMVERWR